MKRVLFFASDFNIGLSSLLTDQVLALHKSGIPVIAVAGEREQEAGLTQQLAELPHVYRIFGLDDHQQFRQLSAQIAKIVKEQRIGVVHVQNNWQLALVAYAKYVLLHDYRLKVVYTLHGFRHNHPFKSVVARLVIGMALLLLSDRVICMSTYLKRKFCWLAYKIELLPLGIPDSFFPLKHELPESSGLLMVFPAQFRYGKNQGMVISAFAQHIGNTGDDVSRLVLPGSGDMLESMKKMVGELGIADRVEFPGQCSKEQIRQIYLRSNIGVVASNSETFGQSIVEPFVLGRCVVTTPVGIAPDIMQEGVGGFFFHNSSELAGIMDRLYADTSLIIRCGASNFRHSGQFRWTAVTERYGNILERL